MDGRAHPAKSVAVQFSRGIYMSVQHVNANHTWVFGFGVFLHCSSGNHFPWVVKDILRCPLLHGASHLPGIPQHPGATEAQKFTSPPLGWPALNLAYL